MKSEKSTTPRKGRPLGLEKLSQTLKKAWRFANEFDLIEKTKENWPKAKAYLASGLLFLSSLTVKANTAENTGSSSNGINTEVKAPGKKANTNVPALDMSKASEFRAYPGKYYNEICNGSPCWLSSTFETNGAGIGKNVSSVATWNDNGNYRGLNQLSPGHAQKFLKWLSTQEEHKNVYEALKKGGVGKANWQAVAKKMEHPMTAAFEDYMVEQYSPENFKAIQEKLNKSEINSSIKKLHPVVLSVIHQKTIQRPAWRSGIAEDMVKILKANHGDESKLNSVEFLTVIYPFKLTPKEQQKISPSQKQLKKAINDSGNELAWNILTNSGPTYAAAKKLASALSARGLSGFDDTKQVAKAFLENDSLANSKDTIAVQKAARELLTSMISEHNDHYSSVRHRAVTILNDSSVNWKQGQFAALVSQAVPTKDDGRSWFDLQEEQKLAAAQQAKRQEKAKIMPESISPSLQALINVPKPTNLDIKKFNITEAKKTRSKAKLVSNTKDSSSKKPPKNKTISQKDLYSETLRNRKRSRDI